MFSAILRSGKSTIRWGSTRTTLIRRRRRLTRGRAMLAEDFRVGFRGGFRVLVDQQGRVFRLILAGLIFPIWSTAPPGDGRLAGGVAVAASAIFFQGFSA